MYVSRKRRQSLSPGSVCLVKVFARRNMWGVRPASRISLPYRTYHTSFNVHQAAFLVSYANWAHRPPGPGRERTNRKLISTTMFIHINTTVSRHEDDDTVCFKLAAPVQIGCAAQELIMYQKQNYCNLF